MFSSQLRSVYRRLDIRSLGAKFLVLGAILIVFALIVGTMTFLEGGYLTRRRLLEQRTRTEADRVIAALVQRGEEISGAGRLLASDSDLVEALDKQHDVSHGALNSRARALRDRFDLALVQIYDHTGLLQVDLVPSTLSPDGAVSSSLLNVAEHERVVARAVADRLLLLHRVPVAENVGTVVVGIDLESELEHIRTMDGLATELGLSLRGTQVGTIPELPFGLESGWADHQYIQTRSVMLGATPAELLLVHPSGDIRQVTQSALIVMAGGTLFATLLLSGLYVLAIRSMEPPLRTLSEAARAVGQGRLGNEVQLASNALTIGIGDELGRLVDAFNQMVRDLDDRQADLEDRIEARTASLAIAAEVAQAVSSNLELGVILKQSTQIIEGRLGRVCPGVHHVGIFLLEDGSDVVVLAEAAGEARDDVVGKSLQVPVGSKSPVGLAVATKRSRSIQNVRMTSTHLKPPLLMDTYSAVAIPLLIGDTLIGALDVQSRQLDAFPLETLQLLNMLANQIATGVHNARLYQQQRQTAEHLAEVDRLKTQFVVMMSHKLSAPLNTITGLSRGLLEGESPLTDQQARDVSLIHSLGRYLLELTDDFLDISKVRAGAITLNLEDVDMRLLIESSLDAVAPLIEGKSITLHAEVDSDLPPVHVDKRRVRQIMLNLLSNAVAFTESGRISVRARRIEALNGDADRMEPFLEVCIDDTGFEIPKEKLLGGLRALARSDNQKTSNCIAAGFALPVTKTLVDLHSGRIWVDGEQGAGATFTFLLPINRFNGSKLATSGKATAGGVGETSHNTV